MDELPLTLPSGLRVRVRAEGPGPPEGRDEVDGKEMFAGRVLRALERGRLVVERRDGGGRLDRAAVEDLSLPDFHALRDAAWRVGAIAAEEEEALTCRNCDRPLSPGPEDAPLGELDDWYLEGMDEPFGPTFPLGRVVRLGGRDVDTFELAPVTVKQVKPLWRALLREEGVPTTPRLLEAYGLRALGALRDRRAIARALEDAPDEVWAPIDTAFVLGAYAPRSHFPYVCPDCGTLHDVLAPRAREWMPEPEAEAILFGDGPVDGPGGEAEPFPDVDRFAELALSVGREVYRDRGIRHVELVVEDGVPPVDGSGEPLMGSYQPLAEGDAAGYTEVRFQIDVYYRTFQKMYEEAPFDLEAELRETIDHEVDHHLAHLAGRDPLDEEEREEALRELERTYGERAVRRARVAGVLGELRTFAWFLLGAVIVLGVIVAFLWWRGGL